jgi:hypothetical protein
MDPNSLWQRPTNRAGDPVPVLPAIPRPDRSLDSKHDPSVMLSSRTPPEAPADLTQTIDTLRRADARFDRIQTEVRNGVVYLRGSISRWEDLFDLARSVSRLPGVKRVILEEVAATRQPRPN